MRVINVAAAQLGPIQKADSREAVVKGMIATEMYTNSWRY
jgi:N-carbamoyl-D-amino-acid hydrolase